MYLIFYKTSDVFAAEERLGEGGIVTEVVPTPVQDKAYCGVCLKLDSETLEAAKLLLESMEYRVVES